MGFFDFLFSKPVYLEDKFFGQLQWLGDKAQTGYSEGKRIFQPTGQVLEFNISAQKTGPTAAHSAFFQWVEAQYPALCGAAGPLITAEFGKWISGFQIQDFEREFTPTFLSIPANAADPLAEWELAFDTVHDQNHTVTVCFVGATPVYGRVDG
ncbi:hypothetical protein LRS06_02190 [Hymenobacter sp. J193]|uniref:hypothetical protein n=1 Tax=Hymenobacter sp. J193 TaxID=2898429 RepID=UPI002151969E|nr:hypothetical protein [Hymenobacter sp. J193]MCR5886601.1 hypothetical protein [Hymenobacter sp. J193]